MSVDKVLLAIEVNFFSLFSALLTTMLLISWLRYYRIGSIADEVSGVDPVDIDRRICFLE